MTDRSFIFLFVLVLFPPSQSTAIMYSRCKVKSIIVIMVIVCTLSATFLLISLHVLQISRKPGSVPLMEQEHKYFCSSQMEKLNVHTGFKQLVPGD